MKINLYCNIFIDLGNPDLKSITEAFYRIQKIILPEFINQVILTFAEHYMSLEKKPFICDHCGNDYSFIWKTRKGKKTNILLVFGMALLNQLQVKCKICGHKINMTLKLLGISNLNQLYIKTRMFFYIYI